MTYCFLQASTTTLAETMPTDKSGLDPAAKLAKLRELMAAADGGVDAYIVPSEDPHMSEYPPDCHARREFISNFTGSAGTAVITRDAALLWTDGRYFLQAEKQLSPDWTLMRMGTDGCPDIPDWLAANVPVGGRVGIDPFLLTVDGARKLEKQLASEGRTLLPLTGDNLVDCVWGDARPQEPQVRWVLFSLLACAASAARSTLTDDVCVLLCCRRRIVDDNQHRHRFVCMQSSGLGGAWQRSSQRSVRKLRRRVLEPSSPRCSVRLPGCDWLRLCGLAAIGCGFVDWLRFAVIGRGFVTAPTPPPPQMRLRGCSTFAAATFHTTRSSLRTCSSPRTAPPCTPTRPRCVVAQSGGAHGGLALEALHTRPTIAHIAHRLHMCTMTWQCAACSPRSVYIFK